MANKHNTFGKGSKHRAVNGGNDKFYTKPFIADYFSHIVLEKFGKDVYYVEPTAGNGVFTHVLPNVAAYDIEPDNPNIIKMDVFNLQCSKEDIIIGNPPFGMNASMAIKIFNHLAKQEVRAICFIVPKTFKKDSTKNKLNLNYHLTWEQDLIKSPFLVDGSDYHVPCTFQIWEYKQKKRILTKTPICKWITFTNKKNAKIAIRRAGGKAGKLLEGIEHSESSTYFITYEHPMIPVAIQLINTSVCDYTAGVRSISKPELCFEINKIMEILNAHS